MSSKLEKAKVVMGAGAVIGSGALLALNFMSVIALSPAVIVLALITLAFAMAMAIDKFSGMILDKCCRRDGYEKLLNDDQEVARRI